MEILSVEYARGDMPETFFKVNGSADKFRRIVFRNFLIKSDDRIIMIDAGCESMPGWQMYDFIGPVKALSNMGYTPEDITDLIITHSHGDHIECVKYFKKSRIYIQRDEYEVGRDNFTDDMEVILFDEECEVAQGVKAVKSAHHSIGSSVVEVTDGDKRCVFAGDEFYVWDTVRELQEQMSKADFVKGSLGRREVFINKYCNEDWKVILSHSE